MGIYGEFSDEEVVREIKEYLENGAVVLDVRTDAEWEEGHSETAKHIVLDTLPDNVDEIESWEKPVIAVCRSGARSGRAMDFLLKHGVDVINGGPWQNVDQFL